MRHPGSAVVRYGMAALFVAVAIGARRLLDPWLGAQVPFVTVFLAVLATAWLAGRGPALAAAALSAVGAAFFLLPPRGSFALAGFDGALGLALYLAASVPAALLAGAMHAARRQAESLAAELEVRVAERTAELVRSHRSMKAREAMLLTVTHKAGVGLALIDAEHRYLFANARVLSLLGLTSERVEGRPVAEVLPDLYHDVIRPRLDRALAGERMRYDVERTPPDTGGPPRIYAVSYEPWTDDDGARHAVVMVDDVTETRKDEEALRRREEWFRTLAESAPQIVWTATPRGGVDYCNRRWMEYTGLGDTSYQEWQWQTVLHPDDAAATVDRWRASVASGEPYEAEVRLRRADGAYRWHLVRGIAARGAGGQIERWLGTSTDIDLQKRAQEAARQFEQRFRLLVEGVTGHAILLLGRHGEIETWSPAAEQVYGYAAREILGQPVARLFPPDEAAAGLPEDELRQAISAGRVEVDGWRARRDGSRFWADGSLAALFDDAGGLTGYALIVRDLTERRESDELLRAILDSTFDAIVCIDEQGRIESFSRAAESMFGYPSREVIGRDVDLLMPPTQAGAHGHHVASYLATGDPDVMNRGRDLQGRRKDGTLFPFEIAVTEFRLAADGRRHFVGVLRDVTARKRLEEQLRWAQRLEAYGQLAGGVAHDFNNLLTVIGGYSEQLLRLLPDEDRCRPLAAEIQRAGERASALTRQLLAFSRQQLLEPRVVDLNEIVAAAEKLLLRLIGEDVRLVTELAPELPPVRVDPGQIEQILLNLAVNARDAMPEGGRLTLATSRVDPDPAAGAWVRLSVADSGTGMTPEVRARIFEPFFTTKEAGRGTGLGLAVVDGVVRQSGGRIEVESAPGAGTAFLLDFPAVSGATTVSGEHQLSPGTAGGSETVLLVEDEAEVRHLFARTLEAYGYLVLEAASGHEALAVAQARPGGFDLLLTDVVMPEMSGRRLAERLREHDPEFKVLFVSGYTDDAVVRQGVQRAEVAFLQKPFTPTGLARKVREVLDGG